MPVGNPGSVKKMVFWAPGTSCAQQQTTAKAQLRTPQAEMKMLEMYSLPDDKCGPNPPVLLDVYIGGIRSVACSQRQSFADTAQPNRRNLVGAAFQHAPN